MRCIRGNGRLVVCATRNTGTTRSARQEASSLHASTKRTDETEIGASYIQQVDDLRSSRTCMPHGPPPAWASNVSQVDLLNLVCISLESMFELNSSHCSETTAVFVGHARLGLADRSTCASLLSALLACLFVLPRGRARAFDIERRTCWLSTTCASLRLTG